MAAHIIDGKAQAQALRAEIKDQVAEMDAPPGLAVVLVGEDPASHVYVRNKIRACEKAGIKSFESRLPAGATQDEVAAEIKAFNENPEVHGILLQLPLPAPLRAQDLTQLIDPAKDVDGLTTENIGRLVAGLDGLVPCTPQGALILIKSVREELRGERALVVGRSLLFGKPMAQLLLAENCTVTTAHSKTRNLPELCRQADILVAAAGQAHMIKGDWIKPGAVVIDVGINRIDNPQGDVVKTPSPAKPDGRLVGDVDFETAKDIASAITPVPGGVGPMTIACLLANTVKAAKSVS